MSRSIFLFLVMLNIFLSGKCQAFDASKLNPDISLRKSGLDNNGHPFLSRFNIVVPTKIETEYNVKSQIDSLATLVNNHKQIKLVVIYSSSFSRNGEQFFLADSNLHIIEAFNNVKKLTQKLDDFYLQYDQSKPDLPN